jgi:pimeloyl-ACP methyl ester carboxylesterase
MMRRSPRTGGIRFATRDNARIAYDPGGIGSEVDLPVVVMLHAMLADHTEFAALQVELAGRYRLILPDTRGHGASPSLQNQWYSVAELTADVIAVLDAEGIASAHLVGHELGGTIAFDVASRHPKRVRSLTLIEPELASVLDNDPLQEVRDARTERRASDRAAGDAAYKQLTDQSLDGFLIPRWSEGWRASVTKPRMGAIRRHAAALAGLLPALDAYSVNRQDAGNVTVPTLILLAEDAGLIDQMIATRLEDWLGHGEKRFASLHARAACVVQDDQAAALARVLLNFWQSTMEE